MTKLKALVAVIGLTALIAIGAACADGEEPEPAQTPTSAVPPTTGVSEPSSGPVTSTMLVPRPENIEVLVRMSHMIVLGTINAVLDEKLIGAYGDDGNPYIPGEESGTPYTDYEVSIERVLKDDGDVEDGGTLVLRMFGHLSQQNDVVPVAAVQLPQPGSHYLLALGRNPDGTYGSGNEGLIYVDGETVAYGDGIPFSTKLTGEEFVAAVRQEAGQTTVTAIPTATPTSDEVSTPAAHGSPPPPPSGGSPLPTLVFEGVRYTHGGSYEAPAGEATTFVIDGIEVNVADLDVAGTTTEGNTHGITDGLQVYRPEAGDTTAVYTFTAGEDRVNPEDGEIFEGRDTWTLWVPMAG